MFDGRIYRAALVPVLFVLVVAGFSVTGRPAPLGSTLAPDAFDGARAFAELRFLAAHYPERRPGSPGDDALARYVAHTIERFSGSAGGGFQVSTRSVSAQTIDGERTLQTVIAERPGSTSEAPLLILAHRDAAHSGSAAELSATACLLELARVFAHSETKRTIVLASTSGGSGGWGGAAQLAADPPGSLDAAIVLGDLAGAHVRRPSLLPYSSGQGVAPDVLTRTLSSAISTEAGAPPGEDGLATQFVHLAIPLSTGEQAPFGGASIPSVLLQVSGERGPAPGDPVLATRLQGFGRAVLSAVYALDEGPDVGAGVGPRLLLGRKTLPSWAVRLLAFALLLAPVLCCGDGLARLRRRGESLGRWLLWAASCTAPFLLVACFAILLGASGLVAAPPGQLPALSLSADGSAGTALGAVLLVGVLAFSSWPALCRRLSLPPRPSSDGAGLAAMLLLLAACSLMWVVNPFASLLLLPAAHLWLLACEPSERPRPLAHGAIALSLLPVVGVLVVYSQALGLGPVGLAESVVLALAGGGVGPFTALLWSVALGSLLAISLLARPAKAGVGPGTGVDASEKILTRGPLTYAGPGSLGGTESALRR